MSNDVVYDLEAIIDFNQPLPLGDYTGKVTAIELGHTKAGDPKITATFDVTEGEYAGHTIDKNYYLKQGVTQNGQKWCRGISDFRADAKALQADSALPKSATLPELKKAFAKVLTGKKVTFRVGRDVNKEDPTKLGFTRISVTGRAGAVQESHGSDPLGDILG